MWQKLSEPTRDNTHDNEYGCAYILDLEHFSKFSVGGVTRALFASNFGISELGCDCCVSLF